MNASNIDLEVLHHDLETSEKKAYVRALAVRTEAGWELHHCWALIGAQPPKWSEDLWEYQDYAFIARRVPATELAVLTSRETGSIFTVGPLASGR
ncbi:hypothetical protein [Streptomyces sp. NPDC057545]|uniref:hypothetical protein n=1 Tax=Streptomyces sp. NPDC057545 TaxID=3346164 RepID=UPI00369074AD